MSDQLRPLLRLGDTHAAVAAVRAILRKVGCLAPHEPELDVVDVQLATGIRFFQQSHGLKADGIVGPQTWARLQEAQWDLGERELRFRPEAMMRGRDVTALQRRLSDLGFNCGRVDGIFGQRTEDALREFQENIGLGPDGICGSATVAAFQGLARAITGGRPERLRDSHSFDGQRTGLAGKVIVLDPGHGGEDLGCVASGLIERDVVADIGLRVERLLSEQGAVVLTTRPAHLHVAAVPDDAARALFANSQQADAVLSLHLDSCESHRASGVAAFYYGGGRQGGHSQTGELLAWELVDSVSAATGLTNLRAHTRQWDLLRLTTMPAVRLYMGYLSNDSDASRFADETFRDLMAKALTQALASTFTPVAVGA